MVPWLRTDLVVQLLVFLVVLVTHSSESKTTTAALLGKIKWRSIIKWTNLWIKTKRRISQKQDANPEISMTSVEIISSRGYPVEVHTVVTDDGYILEVHRIPHGKGQSTDSSTPLGKPVFLQHGFSTSDADWLISPSDRSLAFRLADLGYDVWLGNARGNIYSRKHANIDPSSEAYWKFSWDQMGTFDIPSVVNYILTKTGRAKLSYIGHSMGCAMFFVAMINRPELNDRIEVMMALAPATALAQMKSPIRYFAPFATPLQIVLRLLRTRAFLTRDDLMHRLQAAFCREQDRHKTFFCRNMVFALVDDDLRNISPDLWPVMDGHVPAGTSVRTAAQFAQNYNSGETFIPYSYGWLRNLQRYNGRLTPPPYELNKVTCPVYIFYGDNDLLVGPGDVAWLAGKLGNVKESIKVDHELYNHFDFLWATDNNRVLYDPIISRLPSAL
ncbi:lipase 3-like [Daphnia pulex]|uniref:lipase 3-like n=1 Tax=Daphnia pulex TaxID=6669 RepID=UPI001EDF19AE|nr:lipase 3-like [Daphnia pulex]